MSIRRTLTAVAVDSARDYVRERLTELKKLDLDQDGQRDVDQIVVAVTRIAERVKDSLEATDFQKLASGMEQVLSGASLIGEAVDKQKLRSALAEAGIGLKQLGILARLGIAEIKEQK